MALGGDRVLCVWGGGRLFLLYGRPKRAPVIRALADPSTGQGGGGYHNGCKYNQGGP